MRTQSFVVSLLLSGPALATSQVWVVGPVAGPGIDFTSVQAAVTAAGDGDLVLIRPGPYAAETVVLQGKSLQLVGDVRLGQVDTHCALVAGAGGAASDWMLRNLVLHAPGDGLAALALSDSIGTAWVEGCTLAAEPGSAANGALNAHSVGGLLVMRCDVRPSGGTAIEVSATPVALWNSIAYGAAGAIGGVLQVQPGAGLSSDGPVLSTGCVFEGGAGAPAAAGCAPGAGDGAVGLALSGAASALLTETILFGGGPGSGGSGCGNGAPGAETNAPGATSVNPFGFARGLEVPSPIREGESFLMSFHAIPDEFAFCAWSLESDFAALPELWTVIGLGGAVTIFPVGLVEGGGAVPLALTATELGAGIEFATIYAQPIFYTPFFPPGADWSLGAPSAIVVLDRSL